MKRLVCIILALVMLLSLLLISASADNTATATKTASKVLIDGVEKLFDAYNINGNNYFKLRDIAFVLSGSVNQFEVTWDKDKNAINLISGKSYTVVGGEMQVSKGQTTVSASLTTSRIYLDGREIALTAYNIGGSNYFKLRDIAAAINFGVDYYETTKTILVYTEAKTDDLEILRAVSYGLVPKELQGNWDKTITYAEFCSMLSDMIMLLDASHLPVWEETAKLALASSERMRRDGGMLAIYEAACVIGKGSEIHEGWLDVNALCGEKVWDELSGDCKLFPNAGEPSPFEDNPGSCPGWNYYVSSYFYSLGRCSLVSGKALFDCDVKNATMRVADPFTCKEAIYAIIRLYESYEDVARIASSSYIKTDWSTPLLADAAKRREAILNSKTEIVRSSTFTQGKTYTGTAYYISNFGNDNNDGKSTETAWATTSNISGVDSKLRAGDAVFFERGGIWYVHDLTPRFDNITYSAYGEGSKPIISGSEPNMADKAKWTLYCEGADGVKVWVYYRHVSDVSGILLDNNTMWADKAFADWDGEKFIGKDGKPLNIAALLERDIMFFSDINLRGHVANAYLEDDVSGPLYLRCDKGNPGDVYDSMDMIQRGAAFGVENCGVTIDNLSIRYAALGVNCGLNGAESGRGTLVQNCEFGWCGGNIFYYNNTDEGASTIQHPWMSGAALLMSGCNHSAINNYIHDCDNKVFNIVINNEEWIPTENIAMRGNLLDHNGSALHLCFYVEDEFPDYTMKNITFEDNDVLYTGYGWFTSKQFTAYSDLGTLGTFDTANCHNRSRNVAFSNNLFYLARQGIVHSRYMWGEYRPIYSGNTYVQNVGDILIYGGPASFYALYMGDNTTDTTAKLKEILGDTAGTVITP